MLQTYNFTKPAAFQVEFRSDGIQPRLRFRAKFPVVRKQNSEVGTEPPSVPSNRRNFVNGVAVVSGYGEEFVNHFATSFLTTFLFVGD